MIRVDKQPEPLNFDRLVRRRGNAFLARTPRPNKGQWDRHSYWRDVSRDLHRYYKGVCAYSSHWISYDTGWRTVEHFLPKSAHPEMAYEWLNYRLVCGVLNRKKGIMAIADPFEIENGWFTIDFPSLLVRPSQQLDDALHREVLQTIDILGLNNEDTCMKTRSKYIEDYCKERVDYSHLQNEAPFLANELHRQSLLQNIREIMIYN